PLRVVATFSIVADMAQVIGGEEVEVVTLVGRETDSHAFEPTARENRVLADAQVLVSNGLGFEVWLPRLVQASGFKGLSIEASHGVEPRRLLPHDLQSHAADSN